MTRYSVKRGRRIKKYKKSRKGCRGRARRSIRRCKTRKSKIFRKAKRHTVSNRRNMVGGVVDFPFRITSDEILTYVNSRIDSTVTGLTLIGYCIAFVTKLGGKFGNVANRKNRLEYLVFFRDTNGTLYIARAIYPNDSTKLKVDNTTFRLDLTGMIYDVLKVYIENITRTDVPVKDNKIFTDNIAGTELTTENMVFEATVNIASHLAKIDREEENRKRQGRLNEVRVANGRDAIVVANCDTPPTSVFSNYKVYDETKKAEYSIIIPTSSLPNTVSNLLCKLSENNRTTDFIKSLPIVTYPAVPEPDMKEIADFAGRLLTISDPYLFDPLGQPGKEQPGKEQPGKEQRGFEIPSDNLTPAQVRELTHDKFYTL